MYSRKNLQVDTLYFSDPEGQWFFTPDGVGVIWFDTLKEAREQTGIEGSPVVLHEELED